MLEFNGSPRPRRCAVGFEGGVLTVNGSLNVVNGRGRPVTALQPGWAPTGDAWGLGEFILVALVREDGGRATWVLDDAGRLVGDLERMTKRVNPLLAGRVAAALAQAFAEALVQPADSGRTEAEAQGDQIPEPTLANLVKIAARVPGPRISRLEDSPNGRIRLPASGLDLDAARLPMDCRAVADRLADFAQGFADPSLRLPDLERLAEAEIARHVPLVQGNDKYIALMMRDAPAGPPYVRMFLFIPKIGPEAIYFPQDDRLILSGEFREPIARALVQKLQAWFLGLPFAVQPQLMEPPRSGGMLLRGVRNFGHGLWDEMHTLERILETRETWAATPWIYVLQPESGAALYGDLADIFPELKERFVVVETRAEAANHALRNGVQIHNRSGRLALTATRRRVTAMALRHGAERQIDREARSMPRPTIALGLRLTNRKPSDPLGLYARLTRALTERFGPVGVILDGLNREEGQTGASARISNGVVPLSEGHDELADELAFVEAYRGACAELPVTIVSCIGRPIRENLFWLTQADFFVAPNGGGLAKLRWAMDKPGYVLTSRTNFDRCYLINVYAEPEHTEPPFAPLFMNRPDEVEDLPLDPPREGRAPLRGVPHPDNFIVAEAAVIPRICELVQATLGDRAAGAVDAGGGRQKRTGRH